jgi:hypothetical protein
MDGMEDDEVFLAGLKLRKPAASDEEQDEVEEEKQTLGLQGRSDDAEITAAMQQGRKTKKKKKSKDQAPAGEDFLTSSAPLPASVLSELQYAHFQEGAPADNQIPGKKRKRSHFAEELPQGQQGDSKRKHSKFRPADSDEEEPTIGRQFPFPASSSAAAGIFGTGGSVEHVQEGEEAGTAALRLKAEHFFGARLKRVPIGMGSQGPVRNKTGARNDSTSADAGSTRRTPRAMRQKLRQSGAAKPSGVEKRNLAVLSAVMRHPKKSASSSRKEKAGPKAKA